MTFTNQHLISLLDLTSLNDSDTDETIIALCQKAITPLGNVAAVCVYPQFVRLAREQLSQHREVAVATVVNFPTGAELQEAVLAQTQQAIDDGANEIDLVLPYGELKRGNRQYVFDLTEQVAKLCHQANAKLKVILETGALTAEEMRLAAEIAIDAGADFLKTSTGKIAVGATPEAATILLEAIQARGKADTVGIKLSGGVREVTAAQGYAQQAKDAFGADWVNADKVRIGASALLDALLVS